MHKNTIVKGMKHIILCIFMLALVKFLGFMGPKYKIFYSEDYLLPLRQPRAYPEKTTMASHLPTLSHMKCCIEYTSTWVGFYLTTLVMIGTDCIGSCKSNYHTITTAPSGRLEFIICIIWNSQTCIKRSPLGQRKRDLIREVRPLKRGSIHVKFSMTGQEKGDLLMQVTA
jgi:hypothetical protein